MWLVQTTVNISGQRVNDRDVCRTTAEGKKTFLAKRYGVCRGFKTCWDGPCVCDAKINCVNYCKDVLEQGLLSAIRRISNNDFVVQQDTAPAHHSHHTVAYLCYSFLRLSSLNQKTGRWTLRIYISRIIQCWALQQMVYRHKISHTDQLKQVLIDLWVQVSQDTLNPAIDYSYRYQKEWRWLSKQRVVMLNFVWTNHWC